MEKALILGASGYAGRAIANALAGAYDVFGTCRTVGRDPAGDTGAAMLPFDVAQRGSLREILHSVRPHVIVSALRGDFEQQLAAHREAADYLQAAPNGKLVFLSTANVFDRDRTRPHTEQDDPDPQSEYGCYKAACERMLRGALGAKCAIVRMPAIWGPDCPRLNQLRADLAAHRTIPTLSNILVNVTTDRQVAEFIAFLLREDKSGIFHMGSDDLCDYTQFQRLVCDALQLGTPRFEVTACPQTEYQAVLCGRTDIPNALRCTIPEVISYLTGAATAEHAAF